MVTVAGGTVGFAEPFLGIDDRLAGSRENPSELYRVDCLCHVSALRVRDGLAGSIEQFNNFVGELEQGERESRHVLRGEVCSDLSAVDDKALGLEELGYLTVDDQQLHLCRCAEVVDKDGNVIKTEVVKNATTGDLGTLIFDNLKCGVRYRLTEQIAPEGYLDMTEYIYFTINEDGSVVVEESYYAQAGNTAYNIIVRNIEAIPLPESGSYGTDMFYALGLLLLALAAGIYIYHLRKRRCHY